MHPDMLLDLLRTNASLNQQQRIRQVMNGITCVVATTDDFDHAAQLFVALNGKTGGQGNHTWGASERAGESDEVVSLKNLRVRRRPQGLRYLFLSLSPVNVHRCTLG